MTSTARLLRGIAAVLVGALLGRALLSLAADPSCVSPWPEQQPTDGTWKGSFRLSYQMKYPGTPPIKLKWTGDLNFALASERETGSSVKWTQRSCWRVPLGGKPLQGCDSAGNVLGPAWVQEVTRLERPGRPHVLGRANAAMQFDFATTSGKGDQFKISAPTQAPASLRTVGEVSEPPLTKLLAIQLMGSQGQLNFVTGMSATTASGRIAGTGKASGTGATSGTYVGEENGHMISESVAHQASKQDGNEKQMFRLKLEHSECWLMKGTLDTAQIAASVQGTGMQAENMESEWDATLQERDLKFEQEVERFVQEPVPAKLTWDYVDRTGAELERLLADKSSDYRVCVAAKALKKVYEIQERALQILMDDYPRVSQGATAPVLCAANERLLELAHNLSIASNEECPLVSRALKLIQKEEEALAAKLNVREDTLTCSVLR